MRRKLLKELYRYTAGSISIADLQNWLLSHLQEVLDSEDPVAIDAANSLDSGLVELGEHLIEEADFSRRAQRWIGKLETTSGDVTGATVRKGSQIIKARN